MATPKAVEIYQSFGCRFSEVRGFNPNKRLIYCYCTRGGGLPPLPFALGYATGYEQLGEYGYFDIP